MSLLFNTLPETARVSPTPFKVSIHKSRLTELETLIRLSKLAPHTFENSQTDGRYGVTTEWLVGMRDQWLQSYRWKSSEDRINSFPQWKIEVEDLSIHFVGLFSRKKDAIPILLIHGWPGSFLEFLPILDNFRQEYTPETLPYHLIVPSLPGYTFSSGPPLDKDFNTWDIARVLDQLMKDIGFGNGYVVQGGDIGSHVARCLAVDHESCKAVHLNVCFMRRPEGVTDDNLNAFELQGIERLEKFQALGSGSPMALLAWIGEKYLQWVDEPLSQDYILESVTLYWLTATIARSIYTYRQNYPPPSVPAANDPRWYIQKPFGFSSFPMELAPLPRSWVATTGNLVYWGQHQKGGHFAALEEPEALKTDLTEFVQRVWPDVQFPTFEAPIDAADLTSNYTRPELLTSLEGTMCSAATDPMDIDTVFSDESSFYGDEEEKASLEKQAATFDPEPYWSKFHPKLLSTLQHELRAPTSPAKSEPRASVHANEDVSDSTLRKNQRGRKEPISHFLSRLPPSKTLASDVGPWIWMFGPDSKAQLDQDVPSFVRKGSGLLHAYENESTELRAAHERSGAKTTAPLTRKLSQLRRALERNILDSARECGVTYGKWMLFPNVRNVDSIWKTVVTALDKGKLGNEAKVATDDGSGQTRLICIYTKNFGDKEDVKRVLKMMVEVGLVQEEAKPIYYKCDAYTHLDIKSKNDYGLKASMFSSRDVLTGKV
ncbi:Isopenicillin N synthase [Penicillium argentinense]|uniref:Isopenicillin N synthase n=1 Tax=Penicillium argentinense TaxID=1131581 RepID=A0A9W9KMV0_9EURO|nr:Isopenicillin N synthase [Penicillium argentinense]KAJ5111272.1 Isopenicillin N synthase [Penicillium argentinense]